MFVRFRVSVSVSIKVSVKATVRVKVYLLRLLHFTKPVLSSISVVGKIDTANLKYKNLDS